MARVFSSGFELNSLTAAVEFDLKSGVFTIVGGGDARSGSYGGRVTGPSSGVKSYVGTQFAAVNSTATRFYRTYVRIETNPDVDTTILTITATSFANRVYVILHTDGTLTLHDEDGQIGSASAALSASVWYRLELRVQAGSGAGADTVRARIDGTQFAFSTTRSISTGVAWFFVGVNLVSEACTAIDIYFDDLAINSGAGSFQADFPGSGKIIHLRPSAAGDANTFLVQVGGTAGDANNFTRVNEVTPDDATTYNASAALSSEDLFNMDDSGIGAADSISVVAIGGRFANLVAADATSAFKFEVMKASGGTKAQSAAIIPNSTTWRTNAAAVPFVYPLTTYQDPDVANWTQTTLDSMQVGYLLSAANIQAIALSTVWALVEFIPSSTAVRDLIGGYIPFAR